MLNDAIESHVKKEKPCSDVKFEVHRVILMIDQSNVMTSLLIRNHESVDKNENGIECFPQNVEFGAMVYPAFLKIFGVHFILND